jgi:glycosyltransferase involved in cell wall biosynthesis
MGFVADAAADAGVPLVVTAHGPDIHKAIVDNEWRKSVTEIVARARCIIAVSEAMREKFLAIGCSPQKVRTLYLGAPVPEAVADVLRSDGLINVTCVAGLRPFKGLRYLIEAFAIARQRDNRLRLTLIGDGETRGEIEAQIRAKSLGDCVRLAGWRSPDEVRAQLMRTDIYAQHSITTSEGSGVPQPALHEEGLPISFVEAAACGLPLVGTRTGGVPEICRHGVNGLVVDQKDVEGMAGCLLELTADPGRRAQMGRASRMLVEAEFDQEKQLQKLEELYDDIAGYK